MCYKYNSLGGSFTSNIALFTIMMKVYLSVLLLSLGALVAEAQQKCTGSPRMYNGKPCVSTTRYADSRKGACGCGPHDNDNQFPWNSYGLVAAANQNLFDPSGGKWCGPVCGKCFKLTTTGGFVGGHGGATAEGQSKIFMVTNDCPNEWPNLSWCNQQGLHSVNQYGYNVHFDLENGHNQITGMGWDNPEVTWEWANCDEGHGQDGRTPNYGMYKQCQCRHTNTK
ncbi:endoglucanase-like [Dreissena polymorpha]|nr:endoglucanase-like [Dreissena polymorpha]